MGNALINELNRLANEEYNRKMVEYNAQLAALKADYKAKRKQILAKNAKRTATNDAVASLASSVSRKNTLGNESILPTRRQARDNSALIRALDEAALKRSAGMENTNKLIGYREASQAGDTNALTRALDKAALKRDVGMRNVFDPIEYRGTTQKRDSNALLNALDTAAIQQGANTNNVYGMGTQQQNAYSGNAPIGYTDPTGHDYQSDLATLTDFIHQYFLEHPEDNKTAAEFAVPDGGYERPLPDDLESKGFVVPACDWCSIGQDGDGYYTVVYPNKIQKAAYDASGYYIFGPELLDIWHVIYSGSGYLKKDMFGTMLSTGSALRKMPSGSTGSWMGEGFSVLANYYASYNVVNDLAFDDGPAINEMTFRLYGDKIASSTPEKCLTNYYVYFNITYLAISTGKIQYTTNPITGTIKTIDYIDWDGIDDIKQSTEIDFDYLYNNK